MTTYWLRRNGSEPNGGQYTLDEIAALLTNQAIDHEAEVSADGSHWQPLEDILILLPDIPGGVVPPAFPRGSDTATSEPVVRAEVPPVAEPSVRRREIPVPVGPEYATCRLEASPTHSAPPVSPAPPLPSAAPPPELHLVAPSPGIVWGGLAPLIVAYAITTTLAWMDVASSYSGWTSRFLAFWSSAGSLLVAVAIVGAFTRSAMAHRAIVILSPVCALLVVLFLLQKIGVLGSIGVIQALAIPAATAVAMVAWLQPGAKRYFGLYCPVCHSTSVGADSFTISERRCRRCGSVTSATGDVLYDAYAPPRGVGPAVAPVQDAAGPMAMPSGVATPPPANEVTYARSHYWAGSGVIGRYRDLSWFVFASVVCGALLLLVFMVELPVMLGSRPPRVAVVGIAFVSMLAQAGAIGLFIYWLVWVYKVHAEMRAFTNRAYRISPGKALGFCFIPFFSLYWDVYMPYVLARDTHRFLRRRDVMSPETVLIMLILSAVCMCIFGLAGMVLLAIATRMIQNGLNQLWKEVEEGTFDATPPVGIPLANEATGDSVGVPPVQQPPE